MYEKIEERLIGIQRYRNKIEDNKIVIEILR